MKNKPNKSEQNGKMKTFFGFSEIQEDGSNEIMVLQTGKWVHPVYGEFEVNQQHLTEFKSNFDKGTRGVDIGIDVEHKSFSGYVGWFKELVIRGNALFGLVDWTTDGIRLLKDNVYRYFSPELAFIYEDLETHETFFNVLVGGGITNRPYFKGLKPLLASESKAMDSENGEQFSLLYNSSPMTYAEKLAELASKDKVSAAEFAELKALYVAMSDEEQAAEESKPESIEEKVEAGEPAEGGEGTEGAEGGEGEGGDADPETPEAPEAPETPAPAPEAGEGTVQASEREIKLSEENAALRATVRANEIQAHIGVLVCSDKNQDAAFLPKANAEGRMEKFLMSLNDAQVTEFKALSEMTRTGNLFKEHGAAAAEAGMEPEKVLNVNLTKDAKALSEKDGIPFEEALIKLSEGYKTVKSA